MRCAIYARFSSELQDARSITDQIALCRVHAQRYGWTVEAEYSDAAISGASIKNRPGLQDLVAAAEASRFDIILVEALDRLSRDLADISALWRDVSFLGVRIVTLGEGEIGFMQVGLKGIVGQMFLADLAQKTRRGHIGRLNAGRIPGGKLYGYDVVSGEEKGLRSINVGEAKVIRRIFGEYIAGRSPRAIVADLNRERIPAPRGGLWNSSTINGHPARQNGIIQTRTYVGEVVYNRERMVKDPQSGKRIHKVNPEAEWLVKAAPALAIVDRATFDAAQVRRAESARTHLTYRRRPKHLLSGVVACGCCGHAMIVVREDRLGCSGRINKAICDNNRTIRLREIEARVLTALRVHLLAPEIVAAAVESYRLERERLSKEQARARRDASRELAALDGKIARLVQAIEDGGDHRALTQRLAALEQERAAILVRAPEPIPDNVLALHPTAADSYRCKVEHIQNAITKGDAASKEAMRLVRELISRITVRPSGDGGPPAIEIEGDLAVMLESPQISQARLRRDTLPLPMHFLRARRVGPALEGLITSLRASS